MGTGSAYTNIYAKKILPLDELKDHFLDYLRDRATEIHEWLWNDDGSFNALTPVTPSAFVDSVSVGAAAPFTGASGNGYTIDFGAADPLLQNVLFQNTIGIVYHIGLRAVEVPDDVETNPRTGTKHYVNIIESVGNVEDADGVVDLGAQIRFVVDSVTEVGTPHTGRVVRVWLKIPLSDNPAVAFEDCPVVWDGFNNTITTAGLLGQAAGFVSGNPSDYTVHELGLTIQRLTSGDLRTTTGVLFLAAITGTGPGAMLLPGSIDTTDQHVILWSVTGWLDITRVDIHGDTKVQVTADALDVNEDQITVLDAALVRTFGVDEAGDTYIGGDLDINADVYMSPSSIIHWDNYDYYEQLGIMMHQATGAGPWPAFAPLTYFVGAGGNPHSILLDGTIYFTGTTSVIDAFNWSGTPIEFIDIHTFTNVPLSSNDFITGAVPHYRDTSIIGSINEAQSIADATSPPGVFYGMAPSLPGGSLVQISGGAVWGYSNPNVNIRLRGKHFRLDFGLGIVDLVGQPAGFYYIVVNLQTQALEFYDSASALIAFGDNMVPLVRVYFDGVNCIVMLDLRYFLSNGTKSFLATVGPDTANGAYRRAHNFTTLEAACMWATEVWQVLQFSPNRELYGPIEIRINGPVTVTSSCVLQCAGMKVTSSSTSAECAIYWAGTNSPLFYINADNVTIDGLYLDFLGTGLEWNSSFVRSSAPAGVRSLTVRNCRGRSGFGATSGLAAWIYIEGGGSFLTGLRLENNEFTNYSGSGVGFESFIYGLGPLLSSHIVDNKFVGYAALSTQEGFYFNAGLSNVKIHGNTFSIMSNGISSHTISSIYAWITENLFTDIDNRCVHVSASGNGFHITNNSCGFVSSVDAPCLDLIVENSEINENIIYMPSTAGYLSYAIYLRTGSTYNQINGNILRDVNYGIRVDDTQNKIHNNYVRAREGNGILIDAAASKTDVIGNKVVEWKFGYDGIRVNAPECNITGNSLHVLPGDGTLGIYLTAGADSAVVTGNYIDLPADNPIQGTCGVYNAGASHVSITGNHFNVIGTAVSGGTGVYCSGCFDVTITGNSFTDVAGSAIALSIAVTDFVISSNSMAGTGLAVVVNPITGSVQLDAIFIAAQDGVVSSNTVRACAIGGVAIMLGATSANVVAQLNHKNAGFPGAGVITNLGAGNLIAGGGNL